MLAITSVIVYYTFNNVFLTFYILQVPPKRRRPGLTYPPTLPLDGNGFVNNTLIDVLN